MRRVTILFFLTLLCAVPLRAARPAAAAATEEEPSGALLCLEEPTHDFGDIARKGGDLHWSFAFRNDGDRPLVVTRTFTTCSCLKVRHPRRPVAPGATDTIRVVYEPHKAEAGVFRRTVQIYSNSSAGRAELVIEGNSLDGDRPAGSGKKNRD